MGRVSGSDMRVLTRTPGDRSRTLLPAFLTGTSFDGVGRARETLPEERKRGFQNKDDCFCGVLRRVLVLLLPAALL